MKKKKKRFLTTRYDGAVLFGLEEMNKLMGKAAVYCFCSARSGELRRRRGGETVEGNKDDRRSRVTSEPLIQGETGTPTLSLEN